jgi:exodeoxyribonuclease I
MAFIFYDTETTGTSTSFDQILQFAAIRTDADLNEIDRFEIRCRLQKHVVPSAGAMRVTGATVEQMTDPSLPSHYEMIRQIKAKLSSWSPAIFLGYNSIDFDEHLFRQALYQTLHDPHLTNRNGSCRGDILRCARIVDQFAKGVLNIPVNEKGKPNFKLDQLAPCNGFAHINAHDALGDVEATIHIAKIIRDKAPELWSSLLRFTNKTSAVDHLKNEPVIALGENYFGKAYTFYVTFLGEHADMPGKHAAFDLSVDPESLRILDHNQLVSRLGKQPKPVRSVRVNAHPLFIPTDIAIAQFPSELSEDELYQRAENIASDSDLKTRILVAWAASKEKAEPSPHVEDQIYDGFMGKQDEAILGRFHAVPWSERAALVSQLTDPRYRYLGYRLIYDESNELLPPKILSQLRVDIAGRVLSQVGDEKWNTISQEIKAVDDFLGANDEHSAMLINLRTFLIQLRNSHLSDF